MPNPERQELEELRARARYEELLRRSQGQTQQLPAGQDPRFETVRRSAYGTLGEISEGARGLPFVGGIASNAIRGVAELGFGDQGARQSAAPGLTGQAIQGATLNFGDELQGLAARGVQPLRNLLGENVSPEAAGQAQAQAARLDQRRTAEQYPVSTFGAQLLGGALSGAGLAGATRSAAPALARGVQQFASNRPFLTSALGGLAGGAVAGAGEGETPEERARLALTGGALGGALGGAVPLAAPFVSRGASAVRRAAEGPAEAASRELQRLVRRIPDDVVENLTVPANEQSSQFVGEALGQRGQRLMLDLAQGDDAASEIAQQASRARAEGRTDRIMAQIQRQTGGRRGVEAIADRAAAREQAVPLFNIADQQRINVTPEIEDIFVAFDRANFGGAETGRLAQLLGETESLRETVLRGPTARATARYRQGDPISRRSIEQSLQGRTVKLGDLRAYVRFLENQASTRFTSEGANPAVANQINLLTRRLRNEMGRQSDEYRQAAAIWRDEARDGDAYALGTAVFDEGKNRAQVETDLKSFMGGAEDLSASERGQFMAGVLDAIERRVGTTAVRGDAAGRLTRRNVQDRLAIVFGEEQASRLSGDLLRETQESALDRLLDPAAGSPTAARLNAPGAVDEALRGEGARFAGDVVEDVRGATLQRGRQALGRSIRQASPRQRELLAEFLFTPRSQQAGADLLARAIEQERRRAGLIGGTALYGGALTGSQLN